MKKKEGNPVVGFAVFVGACIVLVVLFWTWSTRRDVPEPAPSTVPSVRPVMFTPHGWVAEDDHRWSCRVDGDHLCGDHPDWTWGIRSYA